MHLHYKHWMYWCISCIYSRSAITAAYTFWVYRFFAKSVSFLRTFCIPFLRVTVSMCAVWRRRARLRVAIRGQRRLCKPLGLILCWFRTFLLRIYFSLITWTISLSTGLQSAQCRSIRCKMRRMNFCWRIFCRQWFAWIADDSKALNFATNE